jgi:hypothetical protein
MSQLRWAVAGAALAVTASLVILGTTSAQEVEKKKKRDADPPNLVGTILSITKDYRYVDEDAKINLQGTKIEVKSALKTKVKTKVGNPFVIMDVQTKVSFETMDKELARGEYVRIWFEDGNKQPTKEGYAYKITVSEDPKKKKAN